MGGLCCKIRKDDEEDRRELTTQTNVGREFNQISYPTPHTRTSCQNLKPEPPARRKSTSQTNVRRELNLTTQTNARRESTSQTNIRREFNPSSVAVSSNHPANQNVRVSTPTIYRFNFHQENLEKYDPNYFPLAVHTSTILPVYRVLPIHESQAEYWKIKRMITNRYFTVHSIEKIDNEALESSYSLKKRQKLKYFPDLEEKVLFHGTKWIYADSICKNNFNWRFSGKEVGHKFGRGVCFSCNAMYAANYSDKDEDEKVMFVAKVLIGKSCLGKYNMKLPLLGYDTSTKQNDDIVVVKYEDNEFYPIYRIKYHIAPGYAPMNRRNFNEY